MRELKKELAEAEKRLKILKQVETKKSRKRRENIGDQEVMKEIIKMLQVRLGLLPTKRYKARKK